jgi:hypothetical protein
MNTIQNYNQHIAEYMDYTHYGFSQSKTPFQYALENYTLEEMEYNTSWDWLMPVVNEITRNEGGNYRKTIETLRQTLVDVDTEDNVFNTITLMYKAVGLYCELHQDFSDEVKLLARDLTEATYRDNCYIDGDGDYFKKLPSKFYQATCLKYSKFISL